MRHLNNLDHEIEMECFICHKKKLSNTRCIHNHFVCDECHMSGLDSIFSVCLNSKSKNPIHILNEMMNLSFCHMHGPEHHIMVGASLLTAYKNAGGDIDLKIKLLDMKNRGSKIPGGVCGMWGACGAGISSGIFISIISGSSPLSNEPFSLSNTMTSKALGKIGEIGGPRCCKRDSYISIIEAVKFTKEHFGIEMELDNVVCNFIKNNNQCIGKRCPFFT